MAGLALGMIWSRKRSGYSMRLTLLSRNFAHSAGVTACYGFEEEEDYDAMSLRRLWRSLLVSLLFPFNLKLFRLEMPHDLS